MMRHRTAQGAHLVSTISSYINGYVHVSWWMTRSIAKEQRITETFDSGCLEIISLGGLSLLATVMASTIYSTAPATSALLSLRKNAGCWLFGLGYSGLLDLLPSYHFSDGDGVPPQQSQSWPTPWPQLLLLHIYAWAADGQQEAQGGRSSPGPNQKHIYPFCKVPPSAEEDW